MATESMQAQIQEIATSVSRLSDAVQRMLNVDAESVIKDLDSKYTSAVINLVKSQSAAQQEATKAGFDFTKYIRGTYYGNNTSYLSGLPIMYLYGDFAAVTKSNKVTLSFKYGDKVSGYKEGTCDCKWQGNSSLSFKKKNLTLSKMSTKLDVGWGEQKKYVLKANHNDFSMARNVVAAKLWGEMVKTRTGTDAITTKLKSLPNGGAIDGFPIMLVVNDIFYGVYTMNIPKDDWMFGMGKGTKEAVLSCEANSPATIMTDSTLTKEDLLAERYMSIEYITDEDDVDWCVTSYNTMVNAVKLTGGTAWEDDVSGYVDVDSFVDSYLFHYITGNGDVVYKNSITATYDGTKWFRSVYDLDQTFGGHWIGHVMTYPSNGVHFNSLNVNRVWGLIYSNSRSRLKTRYNQVKDTVFSEENVFKKFDAFISQIPVNVRNENYNVWPDAPRTGSDPLDQIVTWYRLRKAIVDKAIAAL